MILTLRHTHTHTQSRVFTTEAETLREARRPHPARLLGVSPCLRSPCRLDRAGRPTFRRARILTQQVLITSVSTGDHDWLPAGLADGGGTAEHLAVLSDFQLRKLPTF